MPPMPEPCSACAGSALLQAVAGQLVEPALLKSLAPLQDCVALPDSQVCMRRGHWRPVKAVLLCCAQQLPAVPACSACLLRPPALPLRACRGPLGTP